VNDNLLDCNRLQALSHACGIANDPAAALTYCTVSLQPTGPQGILFLVLSLDCRSY
jgi:hypothetical protein